MILIFLNEDENSIKSNFLKLYQIQLFMVI